MLPKTRAEGTLSEYWFNTAMTGNYQLNKDYRQQPEVADYNLLNTGQWTTHNAMSQPVTISKSSGFRDCWMNYTNERWRMHMLENTTTLPFNTRGFEGNVIGPADGESIYSLGGAKADWYGQAGAKQVPAGGIHAPTTGWPGSPLKPLNEAATMGGKATWKNQAGNSPTTSNYLGSRYGQSLTTGVPYNNPFPLVLIKPLPVMKKDNSMHEYSIMLNATYNIDISVRKQNLQFYSSNFIDRNAWSDGNRASSHLGINWSGLSGWPSGVWKAS